MIRTLLSTMILTSLMAAATVAQTTREQRERHVPLPVEYWAQQLSMDRTQARAVVPEGMQAWIDRSTGMIHRAFGNAQRLPGYDRISADNVRAAADAFLKHYRSSIGVDADGLKLRRITRVAERWYVSWTQRHRGMHVLLTEVELRLHENGNVIAFGADVIPEIALENQSSMNAQDAWDAAAAGLDVAPSMRKAQLPDPAVLPLKSPDGVRCRLVYELPVTEREGTEWLSYVDAADGELLWRRKTTFESGSEAFAHGEVTLVHPHEETLTDRGFGDMYVTVGGREYVTDKSGRLNLELDSVAVVEANFSGPFCRVNMKDRENGAFSGVAEPDAELDIAWTDENSHRFERILFYHTNVNRDYLLNIDPDFTALDLQMKVDIEMEGDQPNAMTNGREVTFVAAGNPSRRFASSPMVLYHELGHCVNILLYEELGRSKGMVNMTCHEGMADLHACLMTDHPGMGTGVFAGDEGRLMRNLVNDAIYPDSLVGEPHHDGQVLSGAFWDLRMATSLELVRRLAHFSKYGTPDDPNTGVAFSEWFLETLIADDDDGDLGNGTPHMKEIAQTFARHNIGPDLYMIINFDHEPLASTSDTLQPYLVDFAFETMDLPGSGATDVHVEYTLNNDEDTYRAEAWSAGSGYRAEIPAQPKGTMVSYTIVAKETLTEEKVRFSGSTGAWQFFVGFETLFEDTFEEDLGWEVGAPLDFATQGIWERENPEEIDMRQFGGPYLQPADDHTDDGRLCYVTGARGGFNFTKYIPDGTTSFTSPSFDVAGREKPVLQFYYQLSRLLLFKEANENKGSLEVLVSTDDGAHWETVWMTTEATRGWGEATVLLDDSITTAGTFLLRFALNAPPALSNGIPPAMCNALVDDVTLQVVEQEGVTPVRRNQTLPGSAALTDVYPNPIRIAATLTCRLARAQTVRLSVHDMFGREVTEIAHGRMNAGVHAMQWNGRDSSGKRVPAGTYFILMHAAEGVMSKAVTVR